MSGRSKRRQAKELTTLAAPTPYPRGVSGRPWFGLYAGEGTRGASWCGPEGSLLVLGPPRCGKTTSVVIPCVLDAPAAVVSTSTKTDVLEATFPRRFMLGRCFLFDPSGETETPPGVTRARWSPLQDCHDFSRAVTVAHALAGAARPQAPMSEAAHWVERAEALLAPLLYVAATKARDMATVCRWVLARDLREPEAVLARGTHEMAHAVLAGVAATEDRERSGIFSTASGILAAYRSEPALRASSNPNFTPTAFVSSSDTLYVCAPAQAQEQLAPLVVCLLDEVRHATFARPHDAAPVVFALDEVANIAPLPSLPSLASEGGGQGLVTLACLQDLSQARQRWGEQAEGFFSIFSTKLLFPGIGDHKTLSLVSALAGEEAVQVISHSVGSTSGYKNWSSTSSTSSSWIYRPRLGIDEVANAPAGSAIQIVGGNVVRVGVEPWWRSPRWSRFSEFAADPQWRERLRPLPRAELKNPTS